MSDASEMVSGKSPNWLPDGWTEHVRVSYNGRKVKCYMDPLTGQKFYSKPQVSEYVKRNSCTSQQEKMGTGSVSNPNMDTLTGDKASVQLEESQNVKTPKRLSSTSKSKQKQTSLDKAYVHKAVIESVTPDGLPEPNMDTLTGSKASVQLEESQNVKTPKRLSSTSKQKQTSLDKAFVHEAVIERVTPDRLPERNMDTLTGDKASVQLEESQNVKTPKRLSSTSKQKQTSLDKASVHEAVVERVTPDGLPEGWIKEIRTQKNAYQTKRYTCYIDPSTGRKFYSKPQVSEYIKRNSCTSQQEKMAIDSVKNPNTDMLTGDEASVKLEESQNVKTPKRSSSTSKKKQTTLEKASIDSIQRAVIKRVTPDGLPAGWIKEIRILKNANGTRKDPYYTDPVTGYVFVSQKDALRYLETGDWTKCAKKPRKREELEFLSLLTEETPISPNKGEITRAETSLELKESQNVKTVKRMSHESKQKQPSLGKQSVEKVVFLKVTADGLPPGWIKEIRIGKKAKGSRRDTYYTDPVSGYALSSHKDVLRYLETGDINKCMKKPRKRSELGSLNEETSGSPDLDELTGAISPKKLEAAQNMKTLKRKRGTSKQKQMGFKKQPVEKDLTGAISPLKLEGAQNMKTLKRKSRASKQKQMGSEKHPVEKVGIKRVTPDGLPPGWIKEIRIQKKADGTRKDAYYTDPVSGYVFRSEKDALRYVESGDITRCTMKPKKRAELGFLNDETSPNTCEITGAISSGTPEPSQCLESLKDTSCASKQKQMSFSKQSVGEVVIERAMPHDLPMGWIKEIRIQKKAHGTRKDPYYTDPVSGYVFRSQQDALRYIETGDITTCAIKPKKRDELGFLNEETSLPSAAIKQKFGHDTTRRQLFVGTENGVTSCLETTDAESSQKKLCICASLEAMATTKPSCSPLPGTKGSNKRKRGIKVGAEKGTEEIGMERKRKRKKQTSSSKSENEEQRLPSRSSKRLAGIKRDLSSNEQALASGKSGDSKATPSPHALDNVSHSAPQQFQLVSETEIQDLDLRDPEEVPSNFELPECIKNLFEDQHNPDDHLVRTQSEKGEEENLGAQFEVPSHVELPESIKKLFEDHPIPEDQLVRTESEKRDEENLGAQPHPSGDSWSDPCLEFAYKTLTDTAPVQESLPGQGYFQQQVETSHAPTDISLVPPGFGVPYFFQNNISSHVAPGNPMSVPQFPTNFTFLPHGDVSPPSSGGNAPQQPNFEGTKEHQTKVNWPWM